MIIEELDILFQKYSAITYKDSNRTENIKLYHQWYDNSRVLFDAHFPEQDKEMLFFSSVDNDVNGYGLYNNFAKIRSSYLVLSNRIKNNHTMTENNDSNKNVFIVHGHDDAMKYQVKSLLQDLELTPIILHEIPNANRTIIQKLLDETIKTCYAITLYSPCDEGRERGANKNLAPRARQNVVFEHGLLIGILGVQNVCCLYTDGVELPGDYSGVLYIPYDENGTWKYNLAKEMQTQGLDVDLNKIK